MRILDLFCGAGGASTGYARAGWEVYGVDLVAQPRYPFPFLQADALGWQALRLIESGQFDAIHASPPCQAYTKLAYRWGRRDHPALIPQVRERVQRSGRPYVIENVQLALEELEDPVMLCGSSFGLDLRRHRLFECSFPLLVPPCAHHWQTPRFRSLDTRQRVRSSVVGVHGHLNYAGEAALRSAAMGIDWMTQPELREAIPPAYTEFIGSELARQLASATLGGCAATSGA